MENEKSIDVLNSLIIINNDRIEGYETAVDETDQQDLKSLFAQFTATSQKCKQELVREVNNLGGTPSEGTKASGKIYRVWMDVKAALTGKDLKAILNSCEFGEDAALDSYDDALKNNSSDINGEHKILLVAQRTLIQADHDKVKSLRDTLENQN